MNLWRSVPGETPIDPSGLKDRSIKTRAQLDRAEALGILDAQLRYFSKRPTRKAAPFNYAWLLRVHKQMFGEVWRWAGLPRTIDLNFGLHWPQVPEQLSVLADDLSHWETNFDLIEQAARLHWRAIAIHPFLGGNGRWARMLANIWLAQHRSTIIHWPDEQIANNESSIRGEYLLALQAADLGDVAPLIELHKNFANVK